MTVSAEIVITGDDWPAVKQAAADMIAAAHAWGFATSKGFPSENRITITLAKDLQE